MIRLIQLGLIVLLSDNLAYAAVTQNPVADNRMVAPHLTPTMPVKPLSITPRLRDEPTDKSMASNPSIQPVVDRITSLRGIIGGLNPSKILHSYIH
jgi:hypothetical protein